ncbi:MAG: prepilin-type N-terminal cleavage/methylation domain-containing protein [Alphaproteobacteria bacterium]|nr:prepilin-type N-terminal cleavage/methylation domain-containing protein [Alphaproteobacteria bacterium]MBV8547973.1 prepilin-type N-terminal cleavage/methylation domain-containing protein [Alphaproteobacteria bacterium]
MAIRNRQCRAFTLIELSIVLVIIGLIIGGALTGQQIIQNARITNAINNLQSYQAQFQTYQQNYGALPGDDASAVTRFGVGVTNGDGNGVIAPSGQTTGLDTFTNPQSVPESLGVWADLRAAGLVKNQIPLNAQPPNPFGGVYTFQNGAFSGSTAFTTTALCMNNVPQAAARAIDTQLDDGSPNSGIIQASTAGLTGAPATDYSASGPYVVCVRL